MSFDGIGDDGQFGIVLANPSMMDAQPGMSAEDARLGIRAAACTVQIGARAPVRFFLDGKSVPRLFGQPLHNGIADGGHCP